MLNYLGTCPKSMQKPPTASTPEQVARSIEHLTVEAERAGVSPARVAAAQRIALLQRQQQRRGAAQRTPVRAAVAPRPRVAARPRVASPRRPAANVNLAPLRQRIANAAKILAGIPARLQKATPAQKTKLLDTQRKMQDLLRRLRAQLANAQRRSGGLSGWYDEEIGFIDSIFGGISNIFAAREARKAAEKQAKAAELQARQDRTQAIFDARREADELRMQVAKLSALPTQVLIPPAPPAPPPPAAPAMPGWVMPVAIGGAALLLLPRLLK